MIVRVGVLAFLLFYFVITLVLLWYGSKNKYRKLIRIPGLEWFSEGVGRATEMGRPILYSTGDGSGGLSSDSAPHHISGLNILGYVAGLAAKTQTQFFFLSGHPELLPLARGIIKDACIAQGNPEFYTDDMVHYYGGAFNVAAIREMEGIRPAAIFWMGILWANAMIVSETGNYLGAIQIAGQPDRFNLPFLIAACDYVMMAEEMYVTGAYVSGDTALIGSISALEFTKILFIVLISIGSILITFGVTWWSKIFQLGGV
jgi:hypothetical protein